MKKLNQKGFSAVEAILIFVIIAMLAGVGWYVWKQNKSSEPTPVTTSNNKATKIEYTAKITSIPADWQTYINKPNKYSLSFPKDYEASSLDFESNAPVSEASTVSISQKKNTKQGVVVEAALSQELIDAYGNSAA